MVHSARRERGNFQIPAHALVNIEHSRHALSQPTMLYHFLCRPDSLLKCVGVSGSEYSEGYSFFSKALPKSKGKQLLIARPHLSTRIHAGTESPDFRLIGGRCCLFLSGRTNASMIDKKLDGSCALNFYCEILCREICREGNQDSISPLDPFS
jgi:hypothetical protein